VIKNLIQRIKLFFSSEKKFYSFLKLLFGFRPKDIHIYELSLIHRSASKVDSQGNPVNNERLEYLGDAIIGAVVAEFLYNRFPGQDEGFLTQMRSKLVNRIFLTKLTHRIKLDQFIQTKDNNTSKSSHIYGDALESLVGALYLDRGYERTREFIIKKLLADHVDLKKVEDTNTNYKSQLIEWCQKNKKKISFETHENIHEENKTPSFISLIKIDDKIIGQGKGKSKKEAHQHASAKAIDTIKEKKTKETSVSKIVNNKNL